MLYIYITKQNNKDMTNLQEEAKRLKEMGSPLSIEAIVVLLEKKEAKKAKNQRRAAKGFERREAVSKMDLQPLWGIGCEFSTQAEYQRSCLGSKWSKR